MHKLDLAKEYQSKVIDVDANDPDAYYSIGVIDWTQAYQPDMEERAKLSLRSDGAIEDKQVCGALRVRNARRIEDGISNLNKALQLRPDYDDAMAYVNLLYRQKADTECDHVMQPAWQILKLLRRVERTMAAKKHKPVYRYLYPKSSVNRSE